MINADELKRLMGEARPLPWRVQPASDVYTHIIRYGENGFICQLPQAQSCAANAALIVAAVNALPELLARLERYDDALDEIAAHYNGGITGPGRLQADSMREIARAALNEPEA